MITAIPTVVSAKPARTTLLERRFPDFLPAIMATANMLRDSGARESPACIALYSRVICKKIGSTIIAPPRVICCSICWEIPILKCGKLNSPGSSNVGFPWRLRRTSQNASATSPTAPLTMSAATASPPSCQTRMPSTTPPIPTTDSAAPTRSIWRGPV